MSIYQILIILVSLSLIILAYTIYSEFSKPNTTLLTTTTSTTTSYNHPITTSTNNTFTSKTFFNKMVKTSTITTSTPPKVRKKPQVIFNPITITINIPRPIIIFGTHHPEESEEWIKVPEPSISSSSSLNIPNLPKLP